MKALRQLPAAPRARRVGLVPDHDGVVVDARAVVERALDRAADPRVEWMVGRLERDEQERVALVVGAGELRLERIEQAAVGGVETRLRDRARGLGAAEKGGEAGRDRRPVRGPVLEAHPRLGDDAERALRAEQHPVGRRARARTGEAPALPHAARRDHADRLHEVVDVRVQGRVVATGSGREPATEGRELERLREMAQREAVRPQRRLECGPVDACLRPGRSRLTVDFEHLIELAQVDAHRAGVLVVEVALHAADDRRAAAVRDRRHAGVAAPVEQRHDVGLVAGARRGRAVGEVAVQPAPDVAVRLAVRVRGALFGVGGAEVGERLGRCQAHRPAPLDLGDGRRLDRLAHLGAEACCDRLPHLRLLLARGARAFHAPSPEAALRRVGGQRHALVRLSRTTRSL